MAVANFESDSVAELFRCLFPVDVEVEPTEKSDHNSSKKIVATYRNDKSTLAAVCQSDFEFAARCATALTMIPRGGCDDAIKSCELGSNYVDNFREIMNLLATLISTDDKKRVFLSDVITPDQVIPDDAVEMIKEHEYSSTLKATVGHYGDGVVSFFG